MLTPVGHYVRIIVTLGKLFNYKVNRRGHSVDLCETLRENNSQICQIIQVQSK